jgi:carboxyl-terminal processing protease
VYDGGGIDPDFLIGKSVYAPITISLMRNNLVFDFATQYYYSHEDIGSAIGFDIGDENYTTFVEWLSDKDYRYTTSVEKKVEELIESAKKEKYYDEIKDQINALKEATLHNKQSDLIKFREEIEFLLEQEIASRYYYQRGVIESTFEKDEDLLTAIDVLNDSERYYKVLEGID